MKRFISIFLVLLMAFAVVGCKKNEETSVSSDFYSSMDKAYYDKIMSDKSVDFSKPVEVVMTVRNFGVIELELYPDKAPVTVANFVNLVQSGFYNGLTFHRIIDGFMIQGGDPKGDGTGGSPNTITGEFPGNGFEQNTLSHTSGVISMARTNDMNSASCQFFICDEAAPHLDGQYAAFGKVTKGMEVVQKISECKTGMNDKPEVPVVIDSVVLKKDYKEPVVDTSMYEKTVDVVISVKSFGDIELELYPDVAPETVANFINLAEDGFYDGLTFHRIIDGFMIQGGDPKGDGTGSSEHKIKGEFSANGFNNPLSHTEGVISMARTDDMNGASCQFFICDADSPFLDGQYAAFGKVTKGMEIVQKISEVAVQYSCPQCGKTFAAEDGKCPSCGLSLSEYGNQFKTTPVTPVVIKSVKVK